MIGHTLGTYEIQEEIGQGGMATVYRAYDSKLKRKVAVKILHGHLTRQKEAVERFQREAHTVAKLRHPNIIEIYDYSGEDSATHYIVTELVNGLDLADFLDRYEEIPCELVACIALELLSALDHAHRQGIVHRDLKPENLMIDRSGRMKLMDFGIARVLEGATLTMTGTILGSPAFMSPEHILGQDVDHRSDLFSLGSMLYLMATGEFPFDGPNTHVILKKVVERDCPPIQQVNPAISNEFARVVERLMETDLDRRYQTAEEVQKDLEALLLGMAIEQPAEEVRGLFRDPDDFPGRFRARMAARVEEKAREAWKKKPALSMQLYTRLSALAPNHPEAEERIARLLRRSRNRKTLAVGASAAAFLAGLALFAWVWTIGHPPEPLNKPVRTETVVSSEPLASYPEKENEENPKLPEPKKEEKHEPRTKKVEARVPVHTLAELEKMKLSENDKTREPPPGDFQGFLKVVTSPWADIYIDGEKVGNSLVDALKRFPVPAGRHTVRLVNPGCVTHTEEIVVEKPDQQLMVRKRLQVLPAYLELKNGQGAMVFVDGDFRGRTPLKRPIEIRWKTAESIKDVLVSLTKEGYEPYTHQLRLVAGKTRMLELDLSPKKNGHTETAP